MGYDYNGCFWETFWSKRTFKYCEQNLKSFGTKSNSKQIEFEMWGKT